MRRKVTLVTGAAGEVGQALIRHLANNPSREILSLDVKSLSPDLKGMTRHIEGSILDKSLLDRLISEYEFQEIYHLAALLSTRSEFTPGAAHEVNVGGTLQLLQLAAQESEWQGSSVRFMFPSSIAVFGLPSRETKDSSEPVTEWEWNRPRTMYGCNKLYCEILGVYFSNYYTQLAAGRRTMLDFRCVRFPGLISAFTLPGGGTSDYGPEMLHAAARGERYQCFVQQDVRIPFMAMADAVKALVDVAAATRDRLQQQIYNVSSFSLSAGEFRDLVLQFFPGAEIVFRPDEKRQSIVDSWPAELDDSAARRDWDWNPTYDLKRTFSEYLWPNVRKRYEKG